MESTRILPQSVLETQPSKLRVAGSSPAAPTTFQSLPSIPHHIEPQRFGGFVSLNCGIPAERVSRAAGRKRRGHAQASRGFLAGEGRPIPAQAGKGGSTPHVALQITPAWAGGPAARMEDAQGAERIAYTRKPVRLGHAGTSNTTTAQSTVVIRADLMGRPQSQDRPGAHNFPTSNRKEQCL